MSTVVLVEARFASTRLPYNVLRRLAQKPMLHWVIQRARQAPSVDRVVVAMPHTSENAPVFAVATEAGADVVTGPENDVLARDAWAAAGADAVVRLTGDNPFVDAAIIERSLHEHTEAKADFTSTCRGETAWPRGYAVEVVRSELLAEIAQTRFDDPTVGLCAIINAVELRMAVEDIDAGVWG